MKFIDEFRNGEISKRLAQTITTETLPDRHYRLMEFCGGHTHAIFRYGIQDLLPPAIQMIHGPGCPVCVLPIGCIDNAIELAQRPNVTLCSYGDMMRVPGSDKKTLLSVKSDGYDVRMVYSCLDALTLARDNPQREIVFFAIGFETTTPPTALAIQTAEREGLNNFTVFCNHVLTPAAISSILESPYIRDYGTIPLDGFIGPAHVSTVIGSQPYTYFAEEYQSPVVIAGFEPLDILQAILMLVRQINTGRHEVENEYTRAVTEKGNQKAQRLVAEYFELRKTFEWRGLGYIPYSALQIKQAYSKFDASLRFDISYVSKRDHAGCACGAIIRGLQKPPDCPLFGTVCTPDSPVGSCMVSAEGACAAYFRYRSHT